MSEGIFKSDDGCLRVTSYCGPADTDERSRMRLQVDGSNLGGVVGPAEHGPGTSIGLREAIALRAALDQWIEAASKPGIPYTIAEIETVLRTHAMDGYHRELMQWLVDQVTGR